MEFDARGLKCPLPIIKLSAALKTIPVGDELTRPRRRSRFTPAPPLVRAPSVSPKVPILHGAAIPEE